jgi:hypothetical protein
MNEHLLATAYLRYCEHLVALKKSGDWKAQHESWDVYVQRRWGMSKSRAKLLCGFVKFRALLEAELVDVMPETPEQVKEILALPQHQWVETWLLVLNYCKPPITPGNVVSCLQHFKVYARKALSPTVRKAIRVRRAARTMSEMENGSDLVSEIGSKALGANWDDAVRVTIEADQARMDAQTSPKSTPIRR